MFSGVFQQNKAPKTGEPAGKKARGNTSARQSSFLDELEADAHHSVHATDNVHNISGGSFLNELSRAEAEDERNSRIQNSARIAQAALDQQTNSHRPVKQANAQDSRDASQSSLSQAEQLNLLEIELEQARQRTKANNSRGQTVEPASSSPEAQSSFNHQSPQNGPSVHQPVSPQWSPVRENPFSFERVVGTVLKGWKTIGALALIGALFGAAYALTLPNKYQATAEILIEPRGLKVLNNSVAPSGLNNEATVAYSESQVRILTSNSVLDPVIDDLELVDDPEFNGNARPVGTIGQLMSLFRNNTASTGDARSQVREHLQKNIFVSRVQQTFTILVGISTTEPEKSARIANAIARSYLADESGARSSAARSVSEDLGGRLDELKESVRRSEEAVESYKADNGLINADGKLVSELKLAKLNEQLAVAQERTSEARTKAQLAAQADTADVISGAFPSELTNSAVSQLRLQYSKAKAKLDRLSTRLGQRHPERIAAAAEQRSSLQAIGSEINRIVQTAQEDFKRARAQQADLEGRFNSLKATAVADSAAKVKLRELTRTVEANRNVYEAFLLRSRETGEQENLRSKSARIISEATPPRLKIGPNRKLIVAAGGIVGGGLGGLLVLLPFAFGAFRELTNGAGRQSTGPAPQPQHSGGDLYSTYEPVHQEMASAPQPAHQLSAEQPRQQQAPPQQSAPQAQSQSPAQPHYHQQAPQQVMQPQPILQAQPAQPVMQPQAQMPFPGMAPSPAYVPQPQAQPQPVYVQAPPMVMQQPVPQAYVQSVAQGTVQPTMIYTPWVPPTQQ